jgi:Icc-related predicted phosphoesterase
MKLLIIGDLHGRMPKIAFKEFDAIIAPGDFCLDTGIRRYITLSYKAFLINPYNYPSWWQIAGKKTAKKITLKSLDTGRKILEKLDSYNVPVYVIPGNWDFVNEDKDWKFLDKNLYKKYLIAGLKNVVDMDKKIKSLKAYSLIGYGQVNGPELLKYRDYKNIKKHSYKRNIKRYKKLVARYNKLFNKAKNPVIFLSHNVPFNTPLDKIKNKDSVMDGRHYGSNLARDMIEKHQPILCIGGHMHEHYGQCKIKKTVVINAGFGPRVNTLIELKDGKIKSIRFHGRKK